MHQQPLLFDVFQHYADGYKHPVHYIHYASGDGLDQTYLPAYKKLTSFLRSLGAKNIVVDSDGDVRKLIPLWLEGGVTGLLPFEAKTGMDIVEIGEQFPTLQIIGGLDKHKLEGVKEDIDAEFKRILPAMQKRGGYILSLDHWVHPQIPLDNFKYYVEKIHAYKW